MKKYTSVILLILILMSPTFGCDRPAVDRQAPQTPSKDSEQGFPYPQPFELEDFEFDEELIEAFAAVDSEGSEQGQTVSSQR